MNFNPVSLPNLRRGGAHKKGLPQAKVRLEKILLEKTKGGKRVLDIFLRACVQHAIAGNSAYANIVWDRYEGPVKTQMEISGPGGEPIQFIMPDGNEYAASAASAASECAREISDN